MSATYLCKALGKNPTYFSPSHKGILYYLACQLKLSIRRSEHLGRNRIKISRTSPPYAVTKWPAPVIQALFMLYINGPSQGNEAANEQHMLLRLWLPRLHFQRQYTADILTTVSSHTSNFNTKCLLRITHPVYVLHKQVNYGFVYVPFKRVQRKREKIMQGL